MLAARITDAHVCPATSDNKPHAGGIIIGPGATTVLIEGLPAALLGDTCSCRGPSTTIISGSSTVIICGQPAVRVGDSTGHGGSIIFGAATVIIG